MNSTKVIEFSKSSLIGLKTELLKKHEEVKKIKEQQGEYIKPTFKPKRTQEKANEGVQERSLKDLEPPLEDDYSTVLQKSREVLLAKSRLYDKLQGSNMKGVENSQYLIDFDEKRKLYDQQEILSKVEDNSQNSGEDEGTDFSDTNSDPENDWVDFVDTLGRSRRCLRKDLPEMEAKDTKLAAALRPPPPPQVPEVSPEMLSWDMQREIMRKQWEEKETELLEKNDIHYQDVLFNEARPHGVGYFEFSTDEQERRRQQQALKDMRGETLEQQEAAKGLRARRQQQLQARLVAARRRRRERLGLPPDETESQESGNNAPQENETQEEEEKVEDLEETIKKIAPVRPWDIGKQISSVMSQEEWVEQKRLERPEEFAPPRIVLEPVQNSISKKKFKKNISKQHIKNNNVREENLTNFVDEKATMINNVILLDNYTDKINDGNLLKEWKSTSQENKTSSKCHNEVQRQSNVIDNAKHNTNYEASEVLEQNTEGESYGPPFKDRRPTSEQIDVLLSNAKAKSSGSKQQEPICISSSSSVGIFTENNFKPVKQSKRNNKNERHKDFQVFKEIKKHQSIVVDQCTLSSDKEVSNKDIVVNNKIPSNHNNFQSTETKNVTNNVNRHKRKWAEIAPPVSMSYYVEDCERNKHSTTERPQLADSIEVGLNYLKTRTEEKGKTRLKGLLDII